MVYYTHWAQSTPVLLLLLERAAAAALGANEITLRVIPWLAALASACILADIFRRLFSPPLAMLGVVLFSANYWAVKYAQQVKPYGTDLLASAVFFWLICVVCRSALTAPRRILILSSGTLLCFLSSQSIFWLPSMAVAFAAAPLDGIDWTQLRQQVTFGRVSKFLGALLLFALAAATNYFFFIRANYSNVVAHDWEVTYQAFLGDRSSLTRLVSTLANLIMPRSSSLSFLAWVIALVIALGTFRALVVARRDPRGLPLLLAGPIPILAALVASALHRYPVLDYPRLLVWALPGCSLLICFAVEPVFDWTLSVTALRQHRLALQTATFALCGFAIIGTFAMMRRSGNGEGELNREMFEKLAAAYKPGDCLFVHGGVAEQYALYSRWLNWHPDCVYIANSNWPCCAINIQAQSTDPAAHTLKEDITSAVTKRRPGTLWLVIQSGAPGAWVTIPRPVFRRLPAMLDQLKCPVQHSWEFGAVQLMQAECSPGRDGTSKAAVSIFRSSFAPSGIGQQAKR
jgi:hypothetical protein